ncbi:MAG: DUF3109 family protein [Bacteroidetes bacterium]|nr:DUF3109 family protein [Bacteroidota bacterium]
MMSIDNIIVDDTIPQIKFACNLSACKGACCTLKGGKGAPLLDSEIEEIENAYPFVQNLLPKEHLETIERDGFYEGNSGNFTTMCFNDRACVFVYYDGENAKCSFERAFIDGLIKWRKPISCHLFPIRVNYFGFLQQLRYERIRECNPALERGARESIYLSQFLKEPLVRCYGLQWYSRFEEFCKQLQAQVESKSYQE